MWLVGKSILYANKSNYHGAHMHAHKESSNNIKIFGFLSQIG